MPSVTDPFFYETVARGDGYGLIAGVDEVGRGPLAGPVVAAAVIVPEGVTLSGVKDSKKMTENAREKAFFLIEEMALATGVGVVSHRSIDEINILNASLEAMKQALLSLDPLPEYLLVDGIHKISVSIPQKCIKKGDQLSLSISAASVIAKVYRDRIMRSYHELFPEYGFLQNKGYGTAHHLAALQRYGPTPIHRLTFKGVC
ncbi:MAG: ribonuclease HII [Deltaproteobacteria bacterium]|nr:ribonuclease HII [Deltaproteobacteria bacterium]